MAALVALAGAWSCSGQVTAASGSASVGSHTASVSSTTGGGGIGGAVGATSGGEAGGVGVTSGGGLGGAGGAGCAAGGVMCAGACTDLSTDPSNCGACGTVCPSSPNTEGNCVAGACVMACDLGWADCNHVASDGCEVHIADDPMNCGACGAACGALPHATAACTQGMCSIVTCDSGWTDCDNQAADGCEADLQNDPMNCGSCGTMCMAGSCGCTQGQCGISCAKGTANCPGDPCNVCATTLGTNENCLFCGDTCALPNATSECTPDTAPPPAPAFTCVLVSCNAGFADCDMNHANGCEVDTITDPANCGGCGNACAPGQSCAGGVCQ